MFWSRLFKLFFNVYQAVFFKWYESDHSSQCFNTWVFKTFQIRSFLQMFFQLSSKCFEGDHTSLCFSSWVLEKIWIRSFLTMFFHLSVQNILNKITPHKVFPAYTRNIFNKIIPLKAFPADCSQYLELNHFSQCFSCRLFKIFLKISFHPMFFQLTVKDILNKIIPPSVFLADWSNYFD